MKKKLFIIVLTVILVVLALTSILVFWALHGPSLDQDQFVSISTSPLINSKTDPYFKLCDTIPCSCDCNDPFDPRIKASEGAFSGKCLNSCVIRTAIEIHDTIARRYGYLEKITDQTQRKKYIANISHRPAEQEEEFYIGVLDPDFVKEVFFMVEYAGGLMGHAEIRFAFDPSHPVMLVPQKTDSDRSLDSTTSLVYSAEAIAPPGVPYKGDYGFREEFFQRYRICSLESKAQTTIKVLHRKVWQYPLNVTAEVKKRMLLAAIAFATNADPQERYHTGKRNCALRAFDVINSGSNIAWYRKPLLFVTNNTLFLPTRAFNHLKYRGLISGTAKDYLSKNLEVELGWEEYIDTTMYQ